MTGAEQDAVFMARALALAERGAWTTRPNPRVGCVIVDAGQQIVGEGWHQRAGEPHAEVFALRQAGSKATGACAYVTLEPCAHVGRTPPCADALIAAGVARVVVATIDPFAQVAGRGIGRLRAAGISVDVGCLSKPARLLNAGFFSRIERQRPWLRMKMATSLDGHTALADGQSQWLTGVEARADVHRWRARACAVLSGVGTVLADDPQLTTRVQPDAEVAGQLRVVVDSALRTPVKARMFDSVGEVLIAHARPLTAAEIARFPARARLWQLPSDDSRRVDLSALLARLALERQINEVHVEAGATLAGALLQAGLVDELLVYQAPLLLGKGSRPLSTLPAPSTLAGALRMRTMAAEVIGDDVRIHLLRA